MTREELDTVATLADILRAKGVSKFKGGGFEMELTAAPEVAAPLAPETLKALAEQEAGTCKCGHAEYAHTNGLCIHGCDVAQCSTEEPAP